MDHIRLLAINGLCLLAVLALAVVVDGNGRILGLSTAISMTVTGAVFTAACVVSGILIGKGDGWARGLGIGLMVLYVAMLLPAILP